MYELTIRKSFSAAHLLKEIGGKCEPCMATTLPWRFRSAPHP
jgi:hypothetical protein